MKYFFSICLLFCFQYCVYSDEFDKSQNNIKMVTASSTLENKYVANNIIDNTYRSWAEGVADDGIGEYFDIEFTSPTRVSGFILKNGYGQLDYYFQNNRVQEFAIKIDGKESGTVKIKDSYEFIQYDLPSVVICTHIQFVINSVYKGTQFNDTCVAEVFITPYNLGDDFEFMLIRRKYAGDNYTMQLIKAAYEEKQKKNRFFRNIRINKSGKLEVETSVGDTEGWFDVPTVSLFSAFIGEAWRGYDGSGGLSNYAIYVFKNTSPLLLTHHYEYSNISENIIPIDIEVPIMKKFENNKWVEKNNDAFVNILINTKKQLEKAGLIFEINLYSDKIEVLGRKKYDSPWGPEDIRTFANKSDEPVQKITYLWTADGFAKQ